MSLSLAPLQPDVPVRGEASCRPSISEVGSTWRHPSFLGKRWPTDPGSPETKHYNATAFLREQLAQGPCDRETLLSHAEAIGLSFRTLERAKSQLGVVSQQRREGGRVVWYWGLSD